LPAGSADAPRVLGKSVAERQLEFALAHGARRLVLLGDGASPQAIALRHMAEKAKCKVVNVSGPHAAASVCAGDGMVLVLQPGVLPSAGGPIERLAGGGVLSLPAGAGIEAGFERIDLARAWAGALVIAGAKLTRLLDLPEDADTNAAILRIALQAQLPEVMLDEDLLARRVWVLLRRGEDAGAIERDWLIRHLPRPRRLALSPGVAIFALRILGPRLLARGGGLAAYLGTVLLLCVAGVAGAWFGFAAAGFAALVVAPILFEFVLGLARLRAAPGLPSVHLRKLRIIIDISLVLASIFAIDGRPIHQLFAPLVLGLALNSGPRSDASLWTAFRDRALAAGIVLAGILLQSAEIGVMAAALLALAAGFATQLRPSKG
jgi:hypothetical protein